MSTPLGDVIRLSWAVTDVSGAAADATVTLSITQPDATTLNVAAGSITHGATGAYSYDFTPTQAGRHLLHWTASGAVSDALDDSFEVDAPATAPLLGLGDMKRFLNLTRTTDDAELYDMGRAISDAIESHVGFPIRRRTVVESREGGGGRIFLRKAPCACAVCAPYRLLAVTNVVEFGTTLTAGTDYQFDADSGVLMRGPWGRGIPFIGLKAFDVVITYTAGYSSTPPWARLAFLRALANSWQSSQQRPHPGFNQRGEEPDPNFQLTPYALPYPVQSMIEPHRLGGF